MNQHLPAAAERERETADGDATARTAAGTAARKSKGRATIKMQIDMPDGTRLGPGKIQLLELIESEGSLSRAAEAMGISYRRAWLFVQQINAVFDRPAIATPKHGRGGAAARLTTFGEELIRQFRQLEALARRDGGTVLRWLERHQSGHR